MHFPSVKFHGFSGPCYTEFFVISNYMHYSDHEKLKSSICTADDMTNATNHLIRIKCSVFYSQFEIVLPVIHCVRRSYETNMIEPNIKCHTLFDSTSPSITSLEDIARLFESPLNVRTSISTNYSSKAFICLLSQALIYFEV
jgi:hypothetical protein